LSGKHSTLAAFALLLGLAGFFFVGNPQKASAADCDDNAIIKCGYSSPSDFIQTVRKNNSGNGHSDLQTVYAHFGLEPSDYDRFVKYSRSGTAYKDGRIVVDGQVVATGAKSIGRESWVQGSGYFSQRIGGTTYYGNVNSKAFASNSIPVDVLFNAKGQMQFAVLRSCGNPEFGNPVTPSYSCNLIHQSPVSGQPGAFTFTTSASAANNAHVVKVVYDFGDGTSTSVSSPSTPVRHIYTKSGSYTAKVTVYVSLPGNQTVTVTSADCATVVKVALPLYQCTNLAATAINDSKYQYKFVVTAKAENGATLKSADFDFGDGKSANGVKASGSTVSTEHTYAKDGAYNAKATVYVSLPDGKTVKVTSADCAHKVPVAIPYYNCVQLTGGLIDAEKYGYTFTATADYGNGATLKSADFDFGDGTTQKNVQPNGTSVTTEHAYGGAGNYTASVTLYFNEGKSTQTAKCTASVSPTQVTPECRPGVPQGSALCSPCASNAALPADSPDCTTTLVNTGASDVVGVAVVAVIAGFFIYRQFIYRKTAVNGVGGMAVGPLQAPPAEEDTLTEQVVAHRQQQPAHSHQQPLHHPTYHRPHRFRPRSHNDQ